jgi:hypothetical protein
MGKVKGGMITGTVHNVVMYGLNGEQIVRGRPARKSKRTLRRRRTEKQWKQQARFTMANKMANLMKELLNETFEKKAGEIGKCQAISYILSSAIKGEYPNYEIDFTNMLVARGRALKAAGAEVSSLAADKLQFSWQDNSGSNFAAADDQAILVAYSEYWEHAWFTMKGGKRSGCGGELNVSGCSGKKVHVWISFRKRNGETADSVYLGEVKIS